MRSMIRHGKRVACNDRCLLVFDGNNYFCKLENISISGVLVQCDNIIPTYLTAGRRCGLLLCSDPKLCPGEYPAKVVRLEASKIALQFLDFEL